MSSGLILEVGGHGSAHLDDLCTAILKEEVVRESIGHTVSKIRTKLVRAQIMLSTVLKFPLDVVASPGGIERFLRPQRCHTSDYRESTPTLNEDRQAMQNFCYDFFCLFFSGHQEFFILAAMTGVKTDSRCVICVSRKDREYPRRSTKGFL